MKASDYKYSAVCEITGGCIALMSNKDGTLLDRATSGNQNDREMNLISFAEQGIERSKSETGVDHIAWIDVDLKAGRAGFPIMPMTKNPEEMEWPDPNSMPPYDEIVVD